MAKQVILCNPYGSDVTNWINGMPLVPQILGPKAIVQPGDTLHTLPYNYRVSSLSNIETAESTMLAPLIQQLYNTTTDDILVFSYSQGCQIADLYCMNNYRTPLSPANRLSFISIGNADRKFGGFGYNQPAFAQVAYTGGLPDEMPWQYQDLARQYDFVADFPSKLTSVFTDMAALTNTAADARAAASAALSSIIATDQNYSSRLALLNSVAGLAIVHTLYEGVRLNSPSNKWYTDPVNGVQYGLSPTYPVPYLGFSAFNLFQDGVYRPFVESQYARPFSGSFTAWK